MATELGKAVIRVQVEESSIQETLGEIRDLLKILVENQNPVVINQTIHTAGETPEAKLEAAASRAIYQKLASGAIVTNNA